MPASFTIVVDLTAPQLTWGTPTGTTAGDVLRVPFTVDEDGVVAADLALADGRHVAVAIRDGYLEALLPVDLETGVGTLTATTRDDVANEATWTLAIALQGVVQPPLPDRPPAGRPPGIQRRPRKFIQTRSAARARDPLEVQYRRTRVRSGHRTASSAMARVFVRTRDQLRTGDVVTVAAQVGARSASRAAPGDASLQRGVGDSITQALLLDLL